MIARDKLGILRITCLISTTRDKSSFNQTSLVKKLSEVLLRPKNLAVIILRWGYMPL